MIIGRDRMVVGFTTISALSVSPLTLRFRISIRRDVLSLFNNNIKVIWLMVFNTTYKYISVISWRSVLLVEETGVPGENHRPVASHWQTLPTPDICLPIQNSRKLFICIPFCHLQMILCPQYRMNTYGKTKPNYEIFEEKNRPYNLHILFKRNIVGW
jgi:hypothetical protein